ncbi:MAG: DUF192 domain-containing protein [Chloroflexi bacterium]|nr:DUF192 domain-containing protein [Chloroflexota bacterium]
MHKVLIKNLNQPELEPIQVGYCSSFFQRLKGLMFHPPLSTQEGILLVYNRDSRMDTSIHMLGVFTDLTVVWINSSNVVVDVLLAKRGKLAYFPKEPARYVLEISPARLNDFKIGDKIQIDT